MKIDWAASDGRLYAASVAAIRRFAEEHPDQRVCFFAFDTDPRYGYVLISLDTLANNIRSAKQLEAFAVEERLRLHKRPDAWESAKYHLSTPGTDTIQHQQWRLRVLAVRRGTVSGVA